MRKMYIQPKNEITKLAPRTIVCASGEFEDVDYDFGGDAPKRRTPVF